ncbi:MAG: hypothetical protein JWM19_894 [Actinomycetia bacterium]|nr:hypothetical protein [Actinomycetes bacterium]
MGSFDPQPGAPAGFLRTTHKPSWLARTSKPLFIADQNLRDRATFPRALGPWVLDSGGFMQLKSTGRWQFTVDAYLRQIALYQEKIGNLAWAAPMDYMCEEDIRHGEGNGYQFTPRTSVLCHQHLTTENYMLACERWPRYGDGPCPVRPVLQGWRPDDYLAHAEMYAAEGVNLRGFDVVGLGSVCRRSSTLSIIRLLHEVSALGLQLHGFGVKREGLRMAGHLFRSADSMAWSMDALHEPPLPGHTHQHCQNCFDYAMQWCDDTEAIFTDPDFQTRNSSLYSPSWENALPLAA